MKKFLIKSLLIICLFCACFSFVNTASADSFSDNTLIYTYYNDKAEFYKNLTNISEFSINSKFIAYTLDKTNITIINRTTKQSYNLRDNDLTFNQIQNITLTKNYLFVSDYSGLGAYDLHNFSKVDLVTSTTNAPLSTFNNYSIFDNNETVTIGKAQVSNITQL